MVLATNGNYTFGIIQIVNVVRVSSQDEIAVVQDQSNSVILTLPYSSNIDQAATMSNVGVPGKYVVDFNGK